MRYKNYLVAFLIAFFALAYVISRPPTSVLDESNVWNPHIDHLTVSSVGDANYTKPDVWGTVLINHTVSLQKSGDSVTYQFKLVNNSGYSAILGGIVKSIPRCKGKNASDEELVCGHLTYSLLDDDGVELREGIILAPKSSKRVKLIVGLSLEASNPTSAVVVDSLDVDFLFQKQDK
jgi:hypothetical protein